MNVEILGSATGVGGGPAGLTFLPEKVVLVGSLGLYSPPLPSVDVYIRNPPRDVSYPRAVEAGSGTPFFGSFLLKMDGGAPLLSLCEFFLQAAPAELLLSGSQYCSESRAMANGAGGESMSVVSTNA